MRANGAATGAAPPGRPRPAAGSGGATEAGGTGGGSRYHHGDLRNALLRAAVALAAEGGPDAVVLRAAARQAGVSATAAYRHFDGHGELLGAVAEHARRRLVTRMEAARRQTRGGTGREAARERLLTLGRGYLGFAREEPGLYRTAFRHRPCGSAGRPGTGTPAGSPGPRSGWGSRPLAVLAAALDEAVAAGLVPAGRRAGAELSAWAMLHGAAMLLLDGPLGALGEEEAARVLDRVPHDIVAGLTAPEGPGTRSL